MKAKRRQSGVTLMEMTVVIAVAAMLAALGLPAIRTFFNSLATEGSTRAMISAALSSARAIAAQRQRYVGVRFQKAYHAAGPLKASQYMIFIVHEEPSKMDGLTIGFRAVEGTQPIKLPENLGVMDLRYNRDLFVPPGDGILDDDTEMNVDTVRDATSFSIVFSPSGKLVIHPVRVRNRDGDYRPVNPNESMDDIFNSLENIVNNNTGMFVQDDYAGLGLWKESSRSSFVIYEEDKFRQAYARGRAWWDYLYKLKPVYINPYTGTIIDSR